MMKIWPALVVLTGTTGAAFAQGAGNASFCQGYAANAAGMADMAIKKNPACLDYSKGVHNNFQMHYDWCMKNPMASAQGAEDNIRRLVTACTQGAAAPPPPVVNPGPQQSQSYQVSWRQVGGNWVNGPYPSKTPTCVHENRYAACNGQNFSGTYQPGQTTTFWLNGCNAPPMQIRCEVRDASGRILGATPMPTNAAPRPVASGAPAPGAVQSAPAGTEEPFGEDIGPWKFTQSADKTCRGYFPGIRGSYIIARMGKTGNHYVSVPGSGFAAGKYPESSINIAGREEMIDATNSGIRFVLSVDNDQFARIIQARGYSWRALDRGKLVTGTVTFDAAVGAANARLRECAKANGGI